MSIHRPWLEVSGLTRSFGAVQALRSVDLTVEKGEMLTLLGPSGSGKSTLLKLIAGFDYPDSGSVVLDGCDVTYASPSSRDIGMVFQNYALFPHLSVFENVAFALRMRKLPRAEIAQKVRDALERVELSKFAERLPRQLSGGQQQRVALARAVVFGPRLLLLDEPFGALDRKLREHMQLEVRRLQRELGLTSVFVTHDQEEALLMSDRIAVVHDGLFAQIGTPAEVYAAPCNAFVAGFVGESNLFKATQGAADTVELEGGARIPGPSARHAVGAGMAVMVRPERVRRLAMGQTADIRMDAKVLEVAYVGETVKYKLRHSNMEMLARWPFEGELLEPGAAVSVGWNRTDMVAVDLQS